MIIGVPKEIKNNENRVGRTPAGVCLLYTSWLPLTWLLPEVPGAECSRLPELPAGRGLFQFLFRILPGSFRKGGDECVGLFPQYDLFIVSTHV